MSSLAVVLLARWSGDAQAQQTSLLAALGLYVPFAFTFSQGAIIHPYFYEPCLAFPLVLALFCLLPAWLERLTGQGGVFVLLWGGLAYCYTWVQLRSYALFYPVQ